MALVGREAGQLSSREREREDPLFSSESEQLFSRERGGVKINPFLERRAA